MGPTVARRVEPAYVAAAAFGVVYAWLALVVFDATSLLSVDAAIKLLQAHSLIDSGFTSLAIPVQPSPIDPTGSFLPFAPPFVFWSGGRLEGVFPSSVALLNAAVLWAGIHGIAALSVVSAVALLIAVAYLSDSALRLWTVIVLGAATPIWFYATVPWEHAPAIALSMWALALAYRNEGWGPHILAGLLGGAAATLREECLVTLPVLVIVVFIRFGWRRALTVGASTALPALLAATADLWVFQRPAAAHLAHAIEPLAGVVRVSLPEPETWSLAERYEVAVANWLFGLQPELWLASALMLAALILTFILRRHRADLALAVVTVVTITHINDLMTYLREPAYVAGLFRLSPVLIFGVLPVASGLRSTWLRRCSISAIAAFVLVALAFVSMDGGAQLGPRLLLPIVPLFAIAAWEGLAGYRNSAVLPERLIGVIGLMLLIGSVLMQVGVGGRAYYRLNAEGRTAIDLLALSTEPVVLIDSVFTMSATIHEYGRRPILLVNSQPFAEQCARQLQRESVDAFVYISRENGARRRFPGFHLSSSRATPVTTFEYWKADP